MQQTDLIEMYLLGFWGVPRVPELELAAHLLICESRKLVHALVQAARLKLLHFRKQTVLQGPADQQESG